MYAPIQKNAYVLVKLYLPCLIHNGNHTCSNLSFILAHENANKTFAVVGGVARRGASVAQHLVAVADQRFITCLRHFLKLFFSRQAGCLMPQAPIPLC